MRLLLRGCNSDLKPELFELLIPEYGAKFSLALVNKFEDFSSTQFMRVQRRPKVC